jgi:hypothetical protein
MEPIEVRQREGTWRIVHACKICGKQTVVDKAADDDFDILISLSLSAG